MFSGGDEDVSKYGDVDSDEKIRERLVFTKKKATDKEIIKMLSKQIVELQEDIEIKDRLLSELQLPAKWDDNIPEYGVLCWVQHNPEGKKKVVTIYSRKNRDDYETALYWIDSRTIVTPLTNEEIEEFKR